MIKLKSLLKESINEGSLYSSQQLIQKLTPKIEKDVELLKKQFPNYDIKLVRNRYESDGSYTLSISGKNTSTSDNNKLQKAIKSKIKESINEGNSLKDFKFVKPTLNFLMFLINKYGTKDHPYADESTINGFSVDYVTKLLKKVKGRIPSNYELAYSDAVSTLTKTSKKDDLIIKKIVKILPHMYQRDGEHNARVFLKQVRNGELKSGVIYDFIKKIDK